MPLLRRAILVGLTLTVHATAQNQAITLTTGIDGGVSYAFDARMVPATGITVEAWITYDDSTLPQTGLSYWPTIARQNVTPNQESWNLRVSAGNTNTRALQFIVRASNNALYNASYPFAPGEFLNWTHVAGSFDGQVIRVFKNGVQVATNSIPVLSQVQNNGGELRVGNGDPVAPGNESWNGSIDELRVWPMARGGEIAAEMDRELYGMPGSLLVFPFNGDYMTRDGSLTGTPYGTIAFGPPAPTTPIAPTVSQVGQPTSTCPRQAELLVGSTPIVGNLDFTFWCVRGPTPAASPAAAVFAADTYVAGLPPVLGITLAFDPTTIAASAVQAPPTNALGNASVMLPIPNQASLIGLGWVFQYVFLDAQCGPQGFSASNGVLITIQ